MRGRLHSIVWTACEEAVCAMLTVGKPVSLVQQKKQQWAQERAEMSNLYLPWGSGERYKNRLNVRNQFASSLELHQTYEYQEPLRRHRSPSLPPIYNIDHERAVLENTQRKDSYNRNVSSVQRFSFYDEDAEGDTSGYGSETVNHKNCRKFYSNPNQSDVVVAWQEEKDGRKRSTAEGALSARSGEEGRPRWGDRGVATGRLWEPTAPNERLPQMQNHKKGTPSWVERGLNNIMDNTSDVVFDPRGSNSGLDCDRSSYNGSDEGRTFLRGQNVPIEPEVKAQRENKRIKALELQSAILGQLEEQEKRREEERLRKLKEERLEELRIQRQQEEDRIRLEEEKRKTLEKQSLEQRKLDTLKKALEEAERRAKQEKEKRFNCLRRNADTNLSNENILATNDNDNETRHSSPSKTLSPTKSNRTYNVPTTATSHNKENNSHQTSAFNSPRSIAPSSLNLYIHNIQPLALADKQINILPIGITGNGEIVNTQNPNNIQLAVLLPQNIKQPECCSVNLNSYDINENNGTERILTPRKYRSGRLKDASTQTDASSTCNKLQNEETEKMYRDYATIDENAPDDHRNTLKRDRRRSEERYKKEIENRPKWGANKPIAQYKKQSEKDPFYVQKRKMRQKYRPQPRQYSQSSDDSRSPSPPLEHDKFQHHNKPRNSISQFFWRTKRHSQDVTPLNPNEPLSYSLDINALSQNEKKSPKISLSKRLTLSQKFINDKYGSRKLWSDDNDKKYLSDIDKKIERNVTNKKDNSNSEIISDQILNMDDLFDKKKDEAPILDLSKVVINTAEEYRAVLDKVPEFKTRPEKVKPEDIKIKDKPEDQKTKTPRKEIREYEKLGTHGYEEKHFTFMDPVPVEMRGLKFDELCAVPIEWRMLTSLRPKSKVDEEYFNRLVELGKSELRTKARDKRELPKNNMTKRTKNRAGVTETRIVTCQECGEEYCNGKTCFISNYDMFVRLKLDVEPKSRAAPANKTRRLRRRARRKRSKSAATYKPNTRKSGTRSDTDI